MNLLSARYFGASLGAALVLACASAPAPSPKAKESRATVTSLRATRPDPSAAAATTIVPNTGRAEKELLSEISGIVSGIQRRSGVTFLRIRSKDAELDIASQIPIPDAECEPRLYCQATMRSESNRYKTQRSDVRGAPKRKRGASTDPQGSHGPEVLVRVIDASALAQLRAITLSISRQNRGGTVQKLRIEGLDDAPQDGALEREFSVSWAEQLRRQGEGEPFAEFAAARVEQRQRLLDRKPLVDGSPGAPPNTLGDLMDFYTGRSEIRRTLQTHRGLGITRSSRAKTLSLAALRGVEHDARDYRALLAGASGVQKYGPHRLAESVPSDALVVEFPTIKDLVTLPGLLDAKLGLILTALEGQPGGTSLLGRYRTQLILEQTKLGERLGHVAIGAVSLVLGDPYLREGTDVSLLFEVRERKLLEAALAEWVAHARTARADIEAKNLTIAGVPVALLATADGRIRRYEAWIGSDLILSNSQRGIERILDVRRNKVPRLSASADYRWARSLAPYQAEAERAFLFYGDAFVEKVTGPRSKILEARRTLAQSELQSVEYATLLFGQMQGKLPKSLDELLASGWLTRADLVHFDGSPIAYDVKTGASSRFGTAEQLLPIVDLDIDRVSSEEASAYDEFRTRYERGLRGALDPTSLRFLRGASDDRWSTELRILPLSPGGEIGSQFREIVRVVGRGAVDVERGPSGLRAVLGVSQGSGLRDLANGAVRGTLRRKDLTLGFLGDWIELGVEDSPWLWNFAVADRTLPELHGPEEDRSEFGFERNLHRLPIWITAQVRSPALLAAALAALRMQSRESLGDWVTWHDGDRHGDIPITRVEVRPNGTEMSPVAIQFAVVKDAIVISTDRLVLTSRIDRVLAGQRPKTAVPELGASQFVLDFRSGSSQYIKQILAGWLEAPAMQAHRRACIGLSLLASGIGETAANSAARGSLALRWLGYVPESPGGPGLSIRDGQCEHPVYGTLLEPVVPDSRDDSQPLHEAIRRLGAVRFGMAVLPRASEQEFVGRVEFEWQ